MVRDPLVDTTTLDDDVTNHLAMDIFTISIAGEITLSTNALFVSFQRIQLAPHLALANYVLVRGSCSAPSTLLMKRHNVYPLGKARTRPCPSPWLSFYVGVPPHFSWR